MEEALWLIVVFALGITGGLLVGRRKDAPLPLADMLKMVGQTTGVTWSVTNRPVVCERCGATPVVQRELYAVPAWVCMNCARQWYNVPAIKEALEAVAVARTELHCHEANGNVTAATVQAIKLCVKEDGVQQLTEAWVRTTPIAVSNLVVMKP